MTKSSNPTSRMPDSRTVVTIARLRNHGIWLGKDIEQFLRETGV